MDTDAAGVWHNSAAIRWTEDAEAELHRRLGIIGDTFGATPRVHIEYDFGVPLYFDDEVEIRLEVVDLGSSSISYGITVERAGEEVASGRVVAVLIDVDTGRARPWPDHLRSVLSEEETGSENL